MLSLAAFLIESLPNPDLVIALQKSTRVMISLALLFNPKMILRTYFSLLRKSSYGLGRACQRLEGALLS